MITKAIIESIHSNKIIVRIPTINKSSLAVGANNTSELDAAPICTLPGISPKYQVGDVVYVSFEDDDLGKPVIIGRLNTNSSSSVSDINIHSLKVSIDADLPKSSIIGDINSNELSKLSGIENNIQRELKHLQSKLEEINKVIENILKHNNLKLTDKE